MARAQGRGDQKASAGLTLILEAQTGFRRMRRADRATGRAGLQEKENSTGVRERLARPFIGIKAAS